MPKDAERILLPLFLPRSVDTKPGCTRIEDIFVFLSRRARAYVKRVIISFEVEYAFMAPYFCLNWKSSSVLPLL